MGILMELIGAIVIVGAIVTGVWAWSVFIRS